MVWDSSIKINIGLTLEMALSDPLLRDSHDYLRFQAFSGVSSFALWLLTVSVRQNCASGQRQQCPCEGAL